jgi:outer membrane protein assembly factor BamB
LTLVALLVAVGALVLSSCDWAQFRYGPEGTGFNPFESTLSASNVSGLQKRWSETSGDSSLQSSPVVANGIVYATSTGATLDAFDATTGTGKWSYQMSSSAYGAPAPAVANGVVYASTNDALYAVDAASGTKLWSAPGGTQFTSPVVANGVVFLSSQFGSLSAFNASTGNALWSTTTGDPFSTPAVADGVVYVGSGDSTLRAFNAVTGAGMWTAPGPGRAGSPAVANNVVYVANTTELYAFDAVSGALLWSHNIGGGSASGSLAVANGVVYESSTDGNLYAYNATTGAPLWPAAMSSAYGGSSPVVANGVVYAGSADGKLEAFDASTGASLWSAQTGASGVEPVVVNGVIYASANDTNLYAYSLPVPGAALTVSPTFTPDYGTILDGNSSPPTLFTVTNFGSSATTTIADTLTGADAAQFHVTSNSCANVPLAGGASCTIGVAFAPTLPGARKATLTVHASTGGATSATLSGIGNALTLDPASKDYGTVVDGSSSPTATFTVTNHSATTVHPAISLPGSQFPTRTDSCSGATLTAGATCNLAIAFNPTGVGPTSANLSASTTPGVTVSTALSGTAQAATITPPTKDYSTVTVGSNAAATFTITNVSSASLTLTPSGSAVTGSGFAITADGCDGTTVAPAASCTIGVTFAPTAVGTYQGQLTLNPFIFGMFIQANLFGKGG